MHKLVWFTDNIFKFVVSNEEKDGEMVLLIDSKQAEITKKTRLIHMKSTKNKELLNKSA